MELPLLYVPLDPRYYAAQRFLDFMAAAELNSDDPLLEPLANCVIVRLICHAGSFPNLVGNIGRLHPLTLAQICRWPWEPERLRDALLKSGWLIENPDGTYVIEGYERHGGKVFAERERHRERRRLAKEKKEKLKAERDAKVGAKPERTPRAHRSRTVRTPFAHMLEGEGEGEGEVEVKTQLQKRETQTATPVQSLSFSAGGKNITTTAELRAMGERRGWRGPPPPSVCAMLPMGAEEFDAAADATEVRAKTPSWGYFLKVARGNREEASEAAQPDKQSNGHAATSKEGRKKRKALNRITEEHCSGAATTDVEFLALHDVALATVEKVAEDSGRRDMTISELIALVNQELKTNAAQ